ncbi:NAD+ kinase [Gelidibacter algens]|uniref:NAD kinase n=1 Tax=Gelidibacter algens TaxID=49280 RepID=A0A1A7R089_9FLAO|nr:NAD kinase [Gelidibacter algens]OBX25665.1 NAD kinase [Gelidibacter algens]RAJ19075.1 NAD+ kinase [Gelidibacter algens]
MKIAIYSQYYKGNEESAAVLLNYLSQKASEVFIEDHFYQLIDEHLDLKTNFKNFKTFQTLDNSFDLLISIGGDGTILRAITFVSDRSIPIIGINTGRLGFLATIQNNQIESALDSIFKGDYKISERSLLSIETQPKNKELSQLNFALNEIALSRKNTTSMITVNTRLNGEYLTTYWADGLIVSTPTGSTGYSLSCGGPVISPDAKSFVITPIAPHNLSARPLVIPDETEIQLKVDGREDFYLISLDSRIATLHNSTIVTVKKADFNIKMIELHSESFIDTLRKKLLWGEDKRN